MACAKIRLRLPRVKRQDILSVIAGMYEDIMLQKAVRIEILVKPSAHLFRHVMRCVRFTEWIRVCTRLRW